MSQTVDRLSGRECLVDIGLNLPEATALDFWQWAFSDLKMNNIRGVFSEWLVAKLLDLNVPVRDSWAPCDLETPDGVRIEVKSGAYLQAWHDEKTPSSKIIFSGLKGKTWSLKSGYSDEQTYNADIYVFCVQVEKNADNWNAFDLDQWRFYLLRRDVLERLGQKTLSLSKLKTLSEERTVLKFQETFKKMVS